MASQLARLFRATARREGRTLSEVAEAASGTRPEWGNRSDDAVLGVVLPRDDAEGRSYFGWAVMSWRR